MRKKKSLVNEDVRLTFVIFTNTLQLSKTCDFRFLEVELEEKSGRFLASAPYWRFSDHLIR
jgi:hypothetical protein